MVNKYSPPDYNTDVDDGIFDIPDFGYCVFKPHVHKEWQEGSRTDIIIYDHKEDEEELLRNLKIGKSVDPATKDKIVHLVKQYWDAFCVKGCRRSVIGYQFAIDTGTSTPVCCKLPNYGPHESRIIMEHIEALLKKDWIEECHGPWGSLIVLAPKPHQEHVDDINDFVWRMCVSYRAINAVTRPFTYPIPRCDNAIHL